MTAALAEVMKNLLNRLKAVFRRLFDIQTHHFNEKLAMGRVR
jgi:hypothetical protein